ncbi:MAG: glycosyltransferase [Methylobacter sp.]|nr:glycosyltransferase [Methylobacter sp.]
MKRIILTSLSGQLGGLELRLSDEARFLTKTGYTAELALNPFPEIYPWVDSLRQEGILFSFFDPPSFFEQWQWHRFNKFRADWFYKRYFKQAKADLVHVAIAWTETGGTRLWLAHRCGLPTVISVHNAFPYHEFTLWHEAILFEAFQSVKGIYAVSDSALEHFLKIFNKFILPNTLLKVIYNPVDIERLIPSETIRNSAREKFGIEESTLLLGVIGRLDNQKQPELLIKVFATLKNRFPYLKLAFIGQGKLEKQCRQQVAELELNDAVLFLGFQKDIAQILPMLDIHVLLSQREGFGIATAEAMACGVPVVATDVSGSRDILSHSKAGILVPKDDFDAIVSRLSTLIIDVEARKVMAEAGPGEVRQRFAKELIEQQLKDFYQAVL